MPDVDLDRERKWHHRHISVGTCHGCGFDWPCDAGRYLGEIAGLAAAAERFLESYKSYWADPPGSCREIQAAHDAARLGLESLLHGLTGYGRSPAEEPR